MNDPFAPLSLEIRHRQTGQIWAAHGWYAAVVVFSFGVLLVLLFWVIYRFVREL